MKMVKSLLLGTAAGLVAMSGAQAADLPVKAKPVQYVKICSLYGAGFYYVPGTDMCLKIGGWVRQYITFNGNGNLTNGALVVNTQTRDTTDWATRTRGYITADARNQTEYGTVRSYIAVGLSANGGTTRAGADPDAGVGPGFSANRAFIQFAGFTFGLSQSFYDIYSGPATSYFGGLINPASDTGDAGKVVTAYTAQFGNGFSASLSAEGRRNTGVYGLASTVSPGALPTNLAESAKWPDVVANVRYDSPWGSLQIMGAVHDASGQYYNNAGFPCATANTTCDGHPSNVVGWAAGFGGKINTPSIGMGDYFQFQFNYSQGASGYENASTSALYSKWDGGGPNLNTAAVNPFGSYGMGVMSDGVYNQGGNVELTTSWGVNAAFEHHWNPHWQTSLYGAYVKTQYNSTANATLCTMESAAAWLGATMTVANGCDNNWATWTVGTRTQWNIDSQTYIGVDVVYQALQSASNGTAVNVAAFGNQPQAFRTLDDQSALMVQFRVHRNFNP
jgi:Porin subfamily